MILCIKQYNFIIQIAAVFTVFDMESGYDFVHVYEGDSTDVDPLASLSGSDVPDPVESTGNTMTIRIVSDGSVNFSGFSVDINFIGKLKP